MTDSEQPRVVGLVAAAPQVDAPTRAAILDAVTSRGVDTEGVLLATCHRVEWFGADVPADGLAGMLTLVGEDAARRVIRLALGLESAVLAEDQILHQLRVAVSEARRRRQLGPDLSLLLDQAMRAGRTGRSWRPRIATSLADRALERVEDVIGALAGRRLLVVGAGEMGSLVARAAGRRGALVVVASRSRARAEIVAAGVSAVSVSGIDPGADVVRGVDAVVVALAGPWQLGRASATALMERAIVIDLSMPSALTPDVLASLGERGLDIDALRVSDGGDAVERHYRARLEALAATTLDGYLAAVADRRRSRADRLAARVERQRREALEAYLDDRPELDPTTRAELDRLTRDLSARFFREPLARLAVDPDGRRGQALDELFGA